MSRYTVFSLTPSIVAVSFAVDVRRRGSDAGLNFSVMDSGEYLTKRPGAVCGVTAIALITFSTLFHDSVRVPLIVMVMADGIAGSCADREQKPATRQINRTEARWRTAPNALKRSRSSVFASDHVRVPALASEFF